MPDPLARTGRECPLCPTWLLRCGHWGEMTLWLCTHDAWLLAHGQAGFPSQGGVHVLLGTLTMKPDCCSSVARGAPSCMLVPTTASSNHDSLPAALEEFHRREALLLEPANV